MTVRALVVMLSCTYAAGCVDPPPSDRLDVESAVAQGLCLAQVRAPRVEVLTLDGKRADFDIPSRPDDKTFLRSGDVTADGLIVASADRIDDRSDALVALQVDGSILSTLSASGPLGWHVALSPDGMRAAFRLDSRLAVVDLSTGRITRLPVGGNRQAWDREGERIAYDDDENVSVYDLRTGINTVIGPGTNASWLPDGTGLAVKDGPSSVAVVTLSDGKRRQFLSRRWVSTPRWSPDGRWMAYSYRANLHPWWSIANVVETYPIVLRDTSTGAERMIGTFQKANPGEFDWVTNRAFCSGELRPHPLLQLAQRWPPPRPEAADPWAALRFRTAWMLVGEIDESTGRWRVQLKHTAARPRRLVTSTVVEPGDVLRTTADQPLIIANYAKTAETRRLESPAGRAIENVDFTGVTLPPGSEVVVREVTRVPLPGQVLDVWVRVEPIAP